MREKENESKNPLPLRGGGGKNLGLRIWAQALGFCRWGGGHARCIRHTLLLLGLSLTACANLSTTGVNDDNIATIKSMSPATLRQNVDALVSPMVDSDHTPAVMVGLLLPDHSMRFFGYGIADKNTDAPPTQNTLFAVGSLSKGFLAAITAQLVNQGVLSWDQTLETLLPQATLSDDAKKITVLQLATHTSGLPRQPVTLQTLGSFLAYLFDGESFYGHFDNAYVMDYLASFQADNAGQPRYSNIGYGLLATIIAQRTGQSVDALLAKTITQPLGLTCTGYTPEILPCNATRAYGYAGDEPMFIPRGDPTPDWDFTGFMRGSAALHSTAHDLLVFADAHIGDKKPLNKILSDNLKIRFPRPKEAMGIAWAVDDVAGQPIAYQIGVVAGYTSYLGIDSTHHTAVVVLQNSFNWDNTVGHKLLLGLRYWPLPTESPQIPSPSL